MSGFSALSLFMETVLADSRATKVASLAVPCGHRGLIGGLSVDAVRPLQDSLYYKVSHVA